MTMLVRDLLSELPLTLPDPVPLDMERLLREPVNIAGDWSRTEGLLCEAISRFPEQLELRIALFKMYAYAFRVQQSLALIYEVLQLAAEQAGFEPDWHKLDDHSADWRHAKGAVRIYLYTLKALGFVSLRAGNLPQAEDALTALARLDPLDQVGGSVVRGMLDSLLEQEQEDAL